MDGAPERLWWVGGEQATANANAGSLHFALRDETVKRFGRDDDVFGWVEENMQRQERLCSRPCRVLRRGLRDARGLLRRGG
jgi:hypothetical protein